MKKNIYIILLLLLFSCDDALFNAGSIITKDIEISDFEEICVNDIFEIYLIQDTVCKIEVKGGSNLIPNLEFNVDEDKKLTINDNNSAQWSRKYDRIQINLHFGNLKKIVLEEPSSVYSADTIRCDYILIHALSEFCNLDLILNANKLHFANSSTSGGLYKITGKTEDFTAWVRGSGKLRANNFNSKHIYLKSSTIGDCYIHAENELTVNFENTGLIYYKGNPQIDIETPEYYNQLIKL